MEFYQWAVPLVAIFYIYRLVGQYRHRKRLLGSTVIWFFFWLAISLLAAFPDPISVPVARFLGFASNINAVIFIALGFLFIFMFYMTSIVEKLEKQMTELIRKMALENQRLKEDLAQSEKGDNEDSLHS